jgi:serine protease Do
LNSDLFQQFMRTGIRKLSAHKFLTNLWNKRDFSLAAGNHPHTTKNAAILTVLRYKATWFSQRELIGGNIMGSTPAMLTRVFFCPTASERRSIPSCLKAFFKETGIHFLQKRHSRLESKSRMRVIAFVYSLAMLVLFPSALQASAQTRGPKSVANIAEKLQAAVVNISTSQKLENVPNVPMPKVPKGSPFEEFFQEFFDKKGGERASSLGSGFIIDSSGLVVTNNHVIESADEITVILNDGTKLKVTKIIGRDSRTDLALLKVAPKTPLTAVKFADSQTMRVGDWVMAIGNPFGLGGTVTVGVISALRRDINAGLYDEYIQTDASINRGNSGGPLFNMDGEVIGVNTAIISPTGGSIGIGFAVPSNTVSQVIEQLKSYGKTRRGWLGLRMQTVSEDIAESLGLTKVSGALVANVSPDGPAAAVGIRVGDIVLKYDGHDIKVMRQLPKLVAKTPVGKEVEIVIFRKGERKTLKVKVGRMDESDSDQPEKKEKKKSERSSEHTLLGMVVAPLTSELRSRYDIETGVKGVVVTHIEPDSPAAGKNIQVGNVIVEVTHQKIKSPEELKVRLKRLRELKRKTALLLVSDPHGEMIFVALPIEKN